MNRTEATKLLRNKMDMHNLRDWHIRLLTDQKAYQFLGLCDYRSKTIFISNHHIDTHPEPVILDTFLHEIAHALTQGHGHDSVWRDKAKEIGCIEITDCGMALNPEVIDAIRSGATVEVSFKEEQEVVVRRTADYKITRILDKCATCGAVAKEISNKEVAGKRFIKLECGHLIIKDVPRGTPFDELVSNWWEPNIAACKHQFGNGNGYPKNKCIKCGEFKLYDFQVKGAQFIEANFGRTGIFDEMGLGKTIQSLAFLKFHPEAFPCLFIVKSAIKYQWFKEILRWLGPDFIPQVLRTGKDKPLRGLKCYVVSYDLLRRLDTNAIKELGIKCVVLDEVQAIKNPDSSRTGEVREIVRNVGKIIPLSGTPWKNRGSEFFVVLNMLAPQKFYSYQSFLNQWVAKYWEGNKEKLGGIRNIPAFREACKDLFIRRERSEVLPELPTINRMPQSVEMDTDSKRQYAKEEQNLVNIFNNSVIDGSEDSAEAKRKMHASIMTMRQIIGMAKIPATLDFVDEFVEDNPERKLAVGVHHIAVGRQIVYSIEKKINEGEENYVGYKLLKLTGEMNAEDRFAVQNEFNETKRAILIASTLASGEGINLQTCSDCLLVERQWNPANEEQFEGRFLRIGSEASQINATYLIADDSVDMHLHKMVESKRLAFHGTMNKGDIPAWNDSDLESDVIRTLVLNAMRRK